MLEKKVSSIFVALLVCWQAAATQWWESASFYQIYPRSFKDSDGDGVGDLNGITQNLHYLKEIGVTATWLSPIFTSPMADFGYDVANFTDIDPLFGTMADFDSLVVRSKKLGVKILLDFVPNHSSDECEWFIKSAAKDSFYKDFYVWHPGKMVNGVRQPPTNWIGVFRGKMWTFHEGRGEYYMHQFHEKQPDLNYRNPKVVEAMKDVLRFWARRGISGFRMDAIPHIFEVAPDSEGNYPDEPRNPGNNDPEDYDYHQHIYTKDQPETVDLIYQFRSVMDEMKVELGRMDDFVLMTEAYTDLKTVMQYYGNATHEGAQIPFNFELLMNIKKNSNALDYESYINQWLNSMPKGKRPNWVMGNHDQPRIASRLGQDKVDIINVLLMALPGCSVNYQGEEIGMTDVWISWKDTKDPQACRSNPQNYERLTRDPNRTPFQWRDQPFAGFTDGSHTWLPVSDNYHIINVETERQIHLSHLNVYKRARYTKKHPVFQRGATEVKALSKEVLAVKRSLPYYASFIALLNFGDTAQTFDLNRYFTGLSPKLKYVVVNDRCQRRQNHVTSSRYVVLSPKEAVILKTL